MVAQQDMHAVVQQALLGRSGVALLPGGTCSTVDPLLGWPGSRGALHPLVAGGLASCMMCSDVRASLSCFLITPAHAVDLVLASQLMRSGARKDPDHALVLATYGVAGFKEQQAARQPVRGLDAAYACIEHAQNLLRSLREPGSQQHGVLQIHITPAAPPSGASSPLSNGACTPNQSSVTLVGLSGVGEEDLPHIQQAIAEGMPMSPCRGLGGPGVWRFLVRCLSGKQLTLLPESSTGMSLPEALPAHQPQDEATGVPPLAAHELAQLVHLFREHMLHVPGVAASEASDALTPRPSCSPPPASPMASSASCSGHSMWHMAGFTLPPPPTLPAQSSTGSAGSSASGTPWYSPGSPALTAGRRMTHHLRSGSVMSEDSCGVASSSASSRAEGEECMSLPATCTAPGGDAASVDASLRSSRAELAAARRQVADLHQRLRTVLGSAAALQHCAKETVQDEVHMLRGECDRHAAQLSAATAAVQALTCQLQSQEYALNQIKGLLEDVGIPFPLPAGLGCSSNTTTNNNDGVSSPALPAHAHATPPAAHVSVSALPAAPHQSARATSAAPKVAPTLTLPAGVLSECEPCKPLTPQPSAGAKGRFRSTASKLPSPPSPPTPAPSPAAAATTTMTAATAGPAVSKAKAAFVNPHSPVLSRLSGTSTPRAANTRGGAGVPPSVVSLLCAPPTAVKRMSSGGRASCMAAVQGAGSGARTPGTPRATTLTPRSSAPAVVTLAVQSAGAGPGTGGSEEDDVALSLPPLLSVPLTAAAPIGAPATIRA